MLYHKLHWGHRGAEFLLGGAPPDPLLNRPWLQRTVPIRKTFLHKFNKNVLVTSKTFN